MFVLVYIGYDFDLDGLESSSEQKHFSCGMHETMTLFSSLSTVITVFCDWISYLLELFPLPVLQRREWHAPVYLISSLSHGV